ncbi:hypothetical protein KJ059_12480 [Myxococcota bacterium]|nr:hypothetical protein [Myxococcota bacterium]MCZ7619640.1 hypothetical protein [Myxococcota bacterium]
MTDAETDRAALRALAAAVIENAVVMATSRAGWIRPEERDAARRFLTDDADPRLESWLSILDVDADAIRSAMRARLRGQRGKAA